MICIGKENKKKRKNDTIYVSYNNLQFYFSLFASYRRNGEFKSTSLSGKWGWGGGGAGGGAVLQLFREYNRSSVTLNRLKKTLVLFFSFSTDLEVVQKIFQFHFKLFLH